MTSEAVPVDRPRPLHAALMELRRTTPESVLARELGVAPKTLKKIYAGTFVELKGAQEDVDAVQRRAWAQTITNLAIKVSERSGSRIDPEKALGEFGLTADDKVIFAAMSREKFGLREVAKQTDPVLNNIQVRAPVGDRIVGVVRAGILSWPPISERDNERSFGRSFCRRLVGTLNPGRWLVRYEERDTINDCLDRLLAGQQGDDVAFGVYSTVSRQLRGLDFISVPGIGIPLHALYYRPKHLEKLVVDWDMISLRAASDEVNLHAYVLEEEVGELYLRGPCAYDEVTTLKTFKHDEIARALKNPPSDKISIFVADRPTCIRVALAMQREEKNFEGWSVRDPSFPGTLFNEPKFPVYRLGMALRADSERWAALLKSAIQEELFRNDRAWTASLYADLFIRSFKELSLVPLEPILPGPVASSFAKAVHDLLVKPDPPLARRDDRLDSDTRERLHRELREVWNLPAGACDAHCDSSDGAEKN